MRRADGMRRRLPGPLARNRMVAWGAALAGGMALVGAIGPWLATANPVRMDPGRAFQAPGVRDRLGTDELGRDVLSRLVHGTRLSLAVGGLVMGSTALLGTAVGLAAGYFRGLDTALMRAMDALMAFPSILLALGIMAALGPRALNVVIALTVVYAPRCARLVRGCVLALRDLEYVQAAQALGAPPARVLWRAVLPNCLAPLVVQETFIFAYAVLSEASLSFLGVGTPPPAPSLGSMLSEARVAMRESPWLSIFPGAALAVTVLGLNLLGDGLRDVLDPRLRGAGGAGLAGEGGGR
jgi:peptide/nickel transport system permease protein